MNKTDLVKATRAGWPDRKAMVDEIFKAINRALIGKEDVYIRNFGRFIVRKSKVRGVYDFRTKQRVPISGKLKIKFIPSPTIQRILNEKNIT